MLARVERFEDLRAWREARVLAQEIYAITRTGKFARDFGLASQIQRAAASVMSNLAEGFDRGSRGEFHHFLVVAKGSCAEVRSQLYLARDVGYIDGTESQRLHGLATQTARSVGALRASVERQRDEQRASGS